MSVVDDLLDATPAPRGEGIQPGRGGFQRNAAGVAQITDPDGTLVKSGPRKGLPRRIPYGAPSSAGKQIENTYNLNKWSERMVTLGLATDTLLADEARQLVGMDTASDIFRDRADKLVVRAKEAAKADLAARQGTHGHALTEDHDTDRDWIARAQDGEDLGIPATVQAALVAAWEQMLDEHGIEIVAVEATCVHDEWRLAGTLDRVARLTRPLTFTQVDGAEVTVPAGTVPVVDIKTGGYKTDSRGAVAYWQSYAIQIAAYAGSVPYDVETETRGEWGFEIDQDHALIAHLDMQAALDGNAVCNLIHVDLAAGRTHGGATVLAAKEWERRNDVFSLPKVSAVPLAEQAGGDGTASGTPDAVTPTPTGGPVRSNLTRRVEAIKGDTALLAALQAELGVRGLPKLSEATAEQLGEWGRALDAAGVPRVQSPQNGTAIVCSRGQGCAVVPLDVDTDPFKGLPGADETPSSIAKPHRLNRALIRNRLALLAPAQIETLKRSLATASLPGLAATADCDLARWEAILRVVELDGAPFEGAEPPGATPSPEDGPAPSLHDRYTNLPADLRVQVDTARAGTILEGVNILLGGTPEQETAADQLIAEAEAEHRCRLDYIAELVATFEPLQAALLLAETGEGVELVRWTPLEVGRLEALVDAVDRVIVAFTVRDGAKPELVATDTALDRLVEVHGNRGDVLKAARVHAKDLGRPTPRTAAAAAADPIVAALAARKSA